MSLHGDLLLQAEHLVQKEPRRPRQASLRRAISTSYYALFHLLIDEACRALVSGPSAAPLRNQIGRAFAHREMQSASRQFAAGHASLPAHIRIIVGPLLPPNLQLVARTFATLQELRHEADYNVGGRFTRKQALALVQQTRQAFGALPGPNRSGLALGEANLYFLAMSLAEPLPRLTEAEYLEIDRAAEFRSEFFDGEMFGMAGGSPEHSLVATNLARELGVRLGKDQCVVYNADLRIKIEATGLCTYPDLSVICGPRRYAAGTNDTVVNPSLLVEVLSDSTEAYDRGKKFEHYRQIPTLQGYLLASQKEPRIEQFTRQADGVWLFSEAAGLESFLEVPSLRIIISLAEIFANVTFVRGPIRVDQARPR